MKNRFLERNHMKCPQYDSKSELQLNSFFYCIYSRANIRHSSRFHLNQTSAIWDITFDPTTITEGTQGRDPFCNMLTCPSSALFLGKLRICLVAWSHFAYVSSQAWGWTQQSISCTLTIVHKQKQAKTANLTSCLNYTVWLPHAMG